MRHPPRRRRPARRRRPVWVIPGLIGLTVMALLVWAIRPALPAEIGHLSAASSTTAGAPLASGYDTSKCVDDDKSGSANGTIVQVWDCNGGANQNWQSVNGTLINTKNGTCLDDPAGASADGTKLQLWDCNGGSNQQWKAENGTLVNPASGKCVDDPAYDTADGTQLVLWTCNGGANQSWSATPATPAITTSPATSAAATSTPSAAATSTPSAPAPSAPAPTPTPTSSGSGGAAPTGPAKTLSVGDNLGAHDPSRIIEDDGSYYFWATGGGGWTSTNGTNWKSLPNLFPHGFPSEVTAILPTNSGLWAPDVIWNPNSQVYDMYYAVALWDDTKNSLIGLITSPTLDPDSPDYHWTDRGIVIQQAPPNTSFSAIDPMPFFDANGNMWMSFGSGYAISRATAINIIALNKDTGLMSGSAVTPVQDCGCEASAVNYHNGYFYLFWNTGGCCSGATSTYLIHVARSTDVTGPYTGNRNFLASTSDEHGPGQIGFISQNGTDYYTYHYYPNTGGSVMGLGVLTWGSDGWPVSSPQ
jgi:arabinan endo-1,5-alpha-L-arabinosidase